MPFYSPFSQYKINTPLSCVITLEARVITPRIGISPDAKLEAEMLYSMDLLLSFRDYIFPYSLEKIPLFPDVW